MQVLTFKLISTLLTRSNAIAWGLSHASATPAA